MAWGLRDAAFCATDTWGRGSGPPAGAPKCSAREAHRRQSGSGRADAPQRQAGCRRRGTEEDGGRVGAA